MPTLLKAGGILRNFFGIKKQITWFEVKSAEYPEDNIKIKGMDKKIRVNRKFAGYDILVLDRKTKSKTGDLVHGETAR